MDVTLLFKRSILIILLLLCSSHHIAVAGDGGLIGQYNKGFYTSPRDSFSITLPVRLDNDKDDVQNIQERLTRSSTLLAIPSNLSDSTYRAEIKQVSKIKDKKNDVANFALASRKAIDYYRRLTLRTFRGPLVELHYQQFKHRGFNAVHAIYKKFAANDEGPRYHLYYLIDFGSHIGFFWTDIGLEKENLELEDNIIEASSGPALKTYNFFSSLKLLSNDQKNNQ